MEKKEWSVAEKIAEELRDKKMNRLLPVLKAAVLGKAKSTGLRAIQAYFG